MVWRQREPLAANAQPSNPMRTTETICAMRGPTVLSFISTITTPNAMTMAMFAMPVTNITPSIGTQQPTHDAP